MIGQTLSHYEITALVGSGGMGDVYKARDTRLDRDVALKVLPPQVAGDPARLRRFQQEARLLAALDHPNIVGVFTVDEAEGVPFITMPLVRGQTLDLLIPDGGMDADRFLDLALQIVEGLAEAHSRGIVHRDLKPTNVMVTAEDRVKILDFGVAKLLSPSAEPEDTTQLISKAGTVVGTVAYMSPEQIEGHAVDVRSDIYSLGVTFYQMLAGSHPFQAETKAATVASILRSEPEPLHRDDLPAALAGTCLSCLRKSPRDRPDAATLRDRLEEIRRAPVADSEQGSPSIAVLPFADMSPQKDQEYFCEGMAEEILNALGQLQGLRTASRTSSSRYRDSQKDSRAIGQELGVSALLEGSVRKAGNHLRITAQLIDTHTDRHLWSERYDRELEDVFSIQEDIAENIVGALKLTLTPGETEALRTPPATDVKAYDFYLRGRTFFRRDTRNSLELARQMFRRATEIDPGFTQAYAGFADSTLYLYKHFLRDSALLDEAEDASAKALHLDRDSAEAHTSRAVVHWLKGEHDDAEREFSTAVRLNPTLFETRYHMAQWCLTSGRIPEAVDHFTKASELAPEDYQSPVLLGGMLRSLGRDAEAQQAFRQGLAVAREHLEAHPDDARAWYLGAGALVALGKVDEGIRWCEEALGLDAKNPLLLLNLASVYSIAGRIDEGVSMVEAAVENGFTYKPAYENDPDLDALRDHPRFQALLERL